MPDAQYALSQLYYHMDLPREKRQEARDWLLKAALAGYDTAQYDMAIWLINGVAGERNYEEGFRWMLIAANRGHVVARPRQHPRDRGVRVGGVDEPTARAEGQPVEVDP